MNKTEKKCIFHDITKPLSPFPEDFAVSEN